MSEWYIDRYKYHLHRWEINLEVGGGFFDMFTGKLRERGLSRINTLAKLGRSCTIENTVDSSSRFFAFCLAFLLILAHLSLYLH